MMLQCLNKKVAYLLYSSSPRCPVGTLRFHCHLMPRSTVAEGGGVHADFQICNKVHSKYSVRQTRGV